LSACVAVFACLCPFTLLRPVARQLSLSRTSPALLGHAWPCWHRVGIGTTPCPCSLCCSVFLWPRSRPCPSCSWPSTVVRVCSVWLFDIVQFVVACLATKMSRGQTAVQRGDAACLLLQRLPVFELNLFSCQQGTSRARCPALTACTRPMFCSVWWLVFAFCYFSSS